MKRSYLTFEMQNSWTVGNYEGSKAKKPILRMLNERLRDLQYERWGDHGEKKGLAITNRRS